MIPEARLVPPSEEAQYRLALWTEMAKTGCAVDALGKRVASVTVTEMLTACDAFSHAAHAYLDAPKGCTPDARRFVPVDDERSR